MEEIIIEHLNNIGNFKVLTNADLEKLEESSEEVVINVKFISGTNSPVVAERNFNESIDLIILVTESQINLFTSKKSAKINNNMRNNILIILNNTFPNSIIQKEAINPNLTNLIWDTIIIN